MFKIFRSKKGQGIIGEYVLIISLVAVAIMGMMVFTRRALQARYRDASVMVVKRASAALAPAVGATGPKVLLEYEPYYTVSETNTISDVTETDKAKGNTFFDKYTNSVRQASSVSQQLPF